MLHIFLGTEKIGIIPTRLLPKNHPERITDALNRLKLDKPKKFIEALRELDACLHDFTFPSSMFSTSIPKKAGWVKGFFEYRLKDLLQLDFLNDRTNMLLTHAVAFFSTLGLAFLGQHSDSMHTFLLFYPLLLAIIILGTLTADKHLAQIRFEHLESKTRQHDFKSALLEQEGWRKLLPIYTEITQAASKKDPIIHRLNSALDTLTGITINLLDILGEVLPTIDATQKPTTSIKGLDLNQPLLRTQSFLKQHYPQLYLKKGKELENFTAQITAQESTPSKDPMLHRKKLTKKQPCGISTS